MDDLTIHTMLSNTVKRFGNRRSLGHKKGEGYDHLTYTELMDVIQHLRRGFHHLGLKRGDRLAILSENRVEWALCDLTAQSMGVVTVPIYPTLPSNQIQYIVRDSGSRIIVVSDEKQYLKTICLVKEVETLDKIVVMDPLPHKDAVCMKKLIEDGATGDPSDEFFSEMERAIRYDDDATIIYTSGTTGEPKGVCLSHRALLHTAKAATSLIHLDETDVFLSFLPLCHIVERVAGHYLPLFIGAQIIYSEGVFAIAGELSNLKPTVFLCVPRLYENMREKILEGVSKLPDHQRKLFHHALNLGYRKTESLQKGKGLNPAVSLQHHLADRLILSKVREKATGGRTRFFVSGGAPLNPRTCAFFQALGVDILEGYGLTEFPVISVNRPGKIRSGSVGERLPDIEVRISEEGEILARGPSRMRCYLGLDQETNTAIDAEGWFHTGDIGKLDSDGYLYITDRIKDIIVLANGKKVAPQPIEAMLKESPLIAEIVLLGDEQNTIMALILPAFDNLTDWANKFHINYNDLHELVTNSEVKRLYKQEIDRLSDSLADFERIKRFALLETPFTIETGELTPTLKVKRKVIAEKFSELIKSM